ncbi:metallophosphoesterase family protein [Actinacidiphila glaucinigra]|uniref:3',5'-cyclic AMP phosphodiesterase CpdA n=1 Tax=Actinacidiphila glaucinigra TaxID=235986 RepID=A0A239LHX5_9ACTN|nr:metallophosphoesterase [Actinacidiphila glaucinigra]SNT30257.1 3',5'-cyclic AMP phosphodiesterase CpdA [Actinacidiphila glaucinigra]
MRILHLSDTHLDRFGSPKAGGVNARESLRGLLNDLEPVADIDVIVISGDIADDGSLDAYLSVRDIVRDFALRRQAPVFYSTGNHDERRAFARALGSGHLRPDGRNHARAMLTSPAGERAAVSMVDGYRFITLDSLVPGMGYGLLGGAQLAWLREVLATPAPMGSVLVLHHPPIALDVEVQHALGLRNPGDLADAIRGTDVRLILCGHFHLQLSGHLESVPVCVTSGVVGRVDLTAPPGTERAVRGASATLVQIGPHGGPLFHTLHARDPRAGETIYELDREQLRTIIDQLGPSAWAAPGS